MIDNTLSNDTTPGEDVEHFPTGMIRDKQAGKIRYDLIPPDALKRLAEVYTKGAEKYAPRNWEKGSPFSRVWASFLRHAMAYWLGEEDGEDDHLAQACWNLMTLMAYEERINSGNLPAELNDLTLLADWTLPHVAKKNSDRTPTSVD